MSANVNIEQTLKNLGEIKSKLDGVQAEAKETMLRSFDAISEQVLDELSAEVVGAAEGAAQMQAEATELLQQADSLIMQANEAGIPQNVVDSLANLAAQNAAQAQEILAKAAQYVEYGEMCAKHAQEIAGRATVDGGWGDMLMQAGIGFSLVFLVLVLLIFIMAGMGLVFTRKKKAEKVAKAAATGAVVAEDDHHEAITDQEIAAAIITALKLYKSNLHDQESEMLTIHRITRAYSPWSSKIHGLTQLPERK
jgi:sodium pump decarboxylase gamma subunit